MYILNTTIFFSFSHMSNQRGHFKKPKNRHHQQSLARNDLYIYVDNFSAININVNIFIAIFIALNDLNFLK